MTRPSRWRAELQRLAAPAGQRTTVATAPLAQPIEASLVAAIAVDEVLDARRDRIADDLWQAAERLGSVELTESGVAGLDDAGRDGLRNALVGTLHDIRVVDQLADGRLPLPDRAVRAELVEHGRPGVDITFHDASGAVVDVAQAKASVTSGEVLEHLRRYPHVDLVYATSDAIPAEATHATITDSQLRAADLHAEVDGVLDDLSGVDATEIVGELLPEASLFTIGATTIWALRSGAPRHHTFHEARQRTTIVVTAGMVGWAVGTATGVDALRLTSVAAYRLLQRRARHAATISEKIAVLDEVLAGRRDTRPGPTGRCHPWPQAGPATAAPWAGRC